jgi:hydrogenase-4 component B
MPRSAEAARAKESGVLMGCGMGVLAVLCLLLGIFPGYALGLIGNIQAAGLDSVKAVPAGGYKMLFLNMPGGFSTLSTPAIFILFAAGFACLYLLMGGVSGRMRKKILYADSWDCGIRALAPRMQYTATAFTKPLRVIFKRIYMPRKEIRISYSVKPFFAREIEYHSDITPFIENFFYSPFKKFIHSAALRAQQLQSGSLHLYLGYILLTLVTVLFIWG